MNRLSAKVAVERLLAADYPDRKTLNLAANENILSPQALKLLSCAHAGRYVIGNYKSHDLKQSTTIGDLVLCNYPEISLIENEAASYLKTAVSAEDVEFRTLSGVHATITSIASLTKPGDLIVSLNPNCGGHFATKLICEKLGRKSDYIKFNVFESTICIDDSLKLLSQAKMVILDPGILRYKLNIKEIRNASPQAILVFDASHILQFFISGLFTSPLIEGVDILQGNTHKSFPGPVKALIFSKNIAHGQKVSDCLDTAFISHSNTGTLLALCQTALEMKVHAKQYVRQMQLNSQALEKELSSLGFDTARHNSQATQTHMVLLCHSKSEEIAHNLINIGMIVNAKRFASKSCIRFGVQEVTRRGFKEKEMKKIAIIIAAIANSSSHDTSRNQVAKLALKFREIQFC